MENEDWIADDTRIARRTGEIEDPIEELNAFIKYSHLKPFVYEGILRKHAMERMIGTKYLAQIYYEDKVISENCFMFHIEIYKKPLFRQKQVICSRTFSFEKTVDSEVNLTVITRIENTTKSIIYKNCLYFGLEGDKKEGSKFVVSNSWQDKMIPTTVNMSLPQFSDFRYVVNHINDFIHSVMTIDDCHAFPLLKVVNKPHGGESLRHNTSCSYFVKLAVL
jgi:hypothetical protein